MVVFYDKKGHMVWGKTHTSSAMKSKSPIDRDVHGKTDLLKVCFDLYCYHCYYLFHWDIYITLVCLFIRCGAEYSYLSRLNVFDVSLKSFKEFKAFWTCYFAYPSVKVTDTFWRVRGQITSRVENMAYESMRAIYFHTNTKWYYHITPIYLGSWIHCGQRSIMCHILG